MLKVFFILVLLTLIIKVDAEQEQIATRKKELKDEIDKLIRNNEAKTRIFLQERERTRLKYHKDMNPELYRLLVKAEINTHNQLKEAAKDARKYLDSVTDPKVLRLLRIMATRDLDFGWHPIWDTDKINYFSWKTSMLSNYAISYACTDYRCKQKIKLFPDLMEAMPAVEDHDLLSQLWQSWSNQIDNANVNFGRMIDTANENSVDGNYYAYWEKLYESEHLTKDVETLWSKLQPLYEELHAYVRQKLIKKYRNVNFESSTIEIQLTKQLWSEDWSSLLDDVLPYEKVSFGDIEKHLRAENVSTAGLYHMVDDYFSSVGLSKAPLSVWVNSVFEKDLKKNSSCLPSVINLFEDDAFAIITCEKPSRSKVSEAFRQMGRLQYFKQCAEQPITFSEGGATFFPEAVGGAIELSAMNPLSLHSLKLLRDYPSDKRVAINYLMGVALQSLPRIAFYYTLDKWQRGLFQNTFSIESANTYWSRYRYQYQGITPPPGIKFAFGPNHYLLYANEPAYPAMLAEILRFEIFNSLCRMASQNGPLHLCTLQYKPFTGAKLARLLSPGLSEPWMKLLKDFNGATRVQVDSLLKFFAPLHKWLKRQNNEENECRGWGFPEMSPKGDRCETLLPSQAESFVVKLLQNYEANITGSMQEMMTSWWSYARRTESLDEATQSSLKIVAHRQAQSDALHAAYLPKVRNAVLSRAVKKARFIEMNLKTDDLAKLINITAQLSGIEFAVANSSYNSSACESYEKCNSIMATSRDLNLLNETWTKWHDRKFGPLAQLLADGIALSNKGAKSSGFDDATEVWQKMYEMENMETEARNRWISLLPFYEQLHAFVRRELQFLYANRFNTSALPAHILGSLTAANWSALFTLTAPCTKCTMLNLDEALQRQQYTSRRMAQMAEQFFQSMGMPPLTKLFWENSDFNQTYDSPDDYTYTWDMFRKDDYRVMASNQVTWKNFVVLHKAVARIQYFMHYANQSIAFRVAPNPALYEAVDGFVSLAASSPARLAALNLTTTNGVNSLNFLMKQALEIMPQLSLDHVMDIWRWKLFRREVPRNSWNSEWWRLRHQYQGIVPPSARTKGSFDPPSEQMWPLDMPSMHRFLGTIIQFQIFQHMCNTTGHTGPLHLCDLYGNKNVGEKLSNMLRLGSSVHWSKALMMVTGNDEISVAPLLNYFQPLIQFLEENNMNKSNCFGWGLQWPLEVDLTLAKPRCEKHMDWPSDPVQKQEILINEFLRMNEVQMEVAYQQAAMAEWRYYTTKSHLSKRQMMEALSERIALEQKQANAAAELKVALVRDAKKLRLLKRIANGALRFPGEDSQLFVSALHNMTRTYESGYICAPEKPHCHESDNRTDHWYLEPDLVNMLASLNDTDLLKYIWTEWHRNVGAQVLPYFKDTIHAFNAAANDSGYRDAGDWWRSFYEEPNLKQITEELWNDILPFYELLHAHVRGLLLNRLPNATEQFTIPAHLLGNMWANDWSIVLDMSGSLTQNLYTHACERMVQQNYTSEQMAREADEFFKSIGMAPMDSFFWNNSLLRSYDSPTMDCQTVAMDFYNGKDFAISHCGGVSLKDLAIFHRLMTHVQYFIAYSKQPVKFREGANPAFHEAVAGAIELSVTSVEHLRKLNLLDERTDTMSLSVSSQSTSQLELGYLYAKALQILPSLTYAYVMDLYRWQIMDGTIAMSQVNNAWWALKNEYQGIAPPELPSSGSFDAGAEYPIVHNVPQIQHFFGQIMQFQFYQALCNHAGYDGPLHRCDITNSTKAGQILARVLSMGSSSAWPEALRLATNSSVASAKPMLDYFEPLINWLKIRTKQDDQCYGWDNASHNSKDLPTPRCSKKTSATGRSVPSCIAVALSCLFWILTTTNVVTQQ
uniref:Angiotensin-converting enzyme n=1 Tax=Trichuris muris TaxID=70415 RepID=A0A5S6QW86_TRIMR